MATTTARSTTKSLILALTCAAQFMVVMDVAIVNVALPSIQRDLSVSESTLQWVVIAYGLLLGGFLLFGGRMADLLGRRRILLTGLTIFSGASLLAGVSQSIGILIAADVAGWITGLVVSIVTVTLAAMLWQSRRLIDGR
jgi:MFS family permease